MGEGNCGGALSTGADFNLNKFNRVTWSLYSSCLASALLSRNYCCHVTSTLYKPDTYSPGRTVGAGPDGVRVIERVDCIPEYRG